MAESLDDFLKGLGQLKEELKTIPDTPVGKVLLEFTQDVVFESQANLAEAGRMASGSLSQSIEPQYERKEEGGVVINFLADYYWEFNDQGVNGVQTSFGAPFSFQTANPSKSMVDSFLGLDGQNWLASKGITQTRHYNAKGEQVIKNLVTEADYRQAAYALAMGTKRGGIEPTYYLTSIFSDERLDQLDQDLINALIEMI